MESHESHPPVSEQARAAETLLAVFVFLIYIYTYAHIHCYLKEFFPYCHFGVIRRFIAQVAGSIKPLHADIQQLTPSPDV